MRISHAPGKLDNSLSKRASQMSSHSGSSSGSGSFSSWSSYSSSSVSGPQQPTYIEDPQPPQSCECDCKLGMLMHNDSSCTPQPPQSCKCDCKCGCLEDASDSPVKFSSGEVLLSETDISAAAAPFAQQRTYSNRLAGNYEGPLGNNWLVPTWPYLVQETAGSDSVLIFVRGQIRIWLTSPVRHSRPATGARIATH